MTFCCKFYEKRKGRKREEIKEREREYERHICHKIFANLNLRRNPTHGDHIWVEDML